MESTVESNAQGVERLVLSYRGWFHLHTLLIVAMMVGMIALAFLAPNLSATARVFVFGVGLLCGVGVVLMFNESKRQIVVDAAGISRSMPLVKLHHIAWSDIHKVKLSIGCWEIVIQDNKKKKIRAGFSLQNIQGLASILLEVVEASRYAQAREILEKVATEKGASKRLGYRRWLAFYGMACLAIVAPIAGNLGSKQVVRKPTAEELRLVIRLDDIDPPGLEVANFMAECKVEHRAGKCLTIRYELRSIHQDVRAMASGTILHSRESAAEATYRELCGYSQKELDRPVNPIGATLGPEEWPLKGIEGKAFMVLFKGKKVGVSAIARKGKAVQVSSCIGEICNLDTLAALMAERLERCQAVKP